MLQTRLFKNGHSQAVRIPAEIAYPVSDMQLLIERVGDEIRIRPATVPLIGDLGGVLRQFSSDFMEAGREANEQAERESL